MLPGVPDAWTTRDGLTESVPSRHRPSRSSAWLVAAAMGLAAFLLLPASAVIPAGGRPGPATPIKHLVVIFQENHSFDVYFATYPVALNPTGQPRFRARPGTPSV